MLIFMSFVENKDIAWTFEFVYKPQSSSIRMMENAIEHSWATPHLSIMYVS